MIIDENDDGYIEEKEWLNIVNLDLPTPKNKKSKTFARYSKLIRERILIDAFK